MSPAVGDESVAVIVEVVVNPVPLEVTRDTGPDDGDMVGDWDGDGIGVPPPNKIVVVVVAGDKRGTNSANIATPISNTPRNA